MATVKVVMPKMGESVMEGTVITWHKSPGDSVETDETILEIGTDKVDSEIPSPATGILTQILVPEGETVDVGTVIAIIETDAEAAVVVNDEPAAAAQSPVVESDPAPEDAEVSEVVAAPAETGNLVDVVMPKMGESVMEGTVISWHKQIGDTIEVDETILEIGTDKVDSEIPSPAAGTLHSILVPEGETVDVGVVIARISLSGTVSAPVAETPSPTTTIAAPAAATRPTASATAVVEQADGSAPERIGPDGRFYSPLVRSMATAEGVSNAELVSITGSGREGRVTKADMLAYLASRGSKPAVISTPVKPVASTPRPAAQPVVLSDDGRSEIIQMDRMRRIIADHMVRSKATSAHVTSFAEIDVTNLVTLREANKHAFQKREGVKLTYTPFFVQAAVEALREHPVLNSSVTEQQIIVRKDYHIGIAVALANAGLIVPVIRNAGTMNLVGLAHAVSNVAARARSKQLMPDELLGGTFTVTNVGSLGSIMGTPIINQPQVGILATGAIKKRPMVVEVPGMGDTIAIRQMMYVSLSYDHRIIDGALASSFLAYYRDFLEALDPSQTL